MSGWLTMVFPQGDPTRIHVVPALGEGDAAEPDPVHEPTPTCGCMPRIVKVRSEVDLVERDIVIHSGPN